MNLASILSFLSAQADQIPTPQIPVPEVSNQSFWKGLEGLSLDELIQKMVNGLISFGLKVLLAILVFYVGRYIIRKLYKVVYNIMTHRHIDQSLTTFVLSLIRMVLYFILVISIIGILGLETSSFLAIFASAGVAIGMALSGTLQNFAGGVLILLLKPYKVGDFIEVNGFTGTVKSIQLFNTVINTVDNKAIILPNGALSTGSINNYSLESYRRVDWTVCLAYGTDLDKAKEALMEIVQADPRVVKKYIEDDELYKQQNLIDKRVVSVQNKVERPPFVGLNEMADSSINFVVRAWTHASNYWPLYFDINERIYKELPEKGFSFPFPQMDVHLDHNV